MRLNAAAQRRTCLSPARIGTPLFPQFPGAPERSIEDLKARYYSVARQLLVGREGGPESVANNVLVSAAAACVVCCASVAAQSNTRCQMVPYGRGSVAPSATIS